MNKFLMGVLLCTLCTSASAEVLFKCHQPFSVFDSSFEQGQELYLDIEVEGDNVILDFGRSFGPSLFPMDPEKTKNFFFGEGANSFTTHWDKQYLSMVFLGGQWGAYVQIGENELGLPKEVEFLCREAVDVLEFVTNLN